MACKNCDKSTPNSPCKDCQGKCDNGYLDSSCVIYNGDSFACTNVNTGDNLQDIIQQISAKFCQINPLFFQLVVCAPTLDVFVSTQDQYDFFLEAIPDENRPILVYVNGLTLPSTAWLLGIDPRDVLLIDPLNAGDEVQIFYYTCQIELL